jgi:hypothetical protein
MSKKASAHVRFYVRATAPPVAAGLGGWRKGLAALAGLALLGALASGLWLGFRFFGPTGEFSTTGSPPETPSAARPVTENWVLVGLIKWRDKNLSPRFPGATIDLLDYATVEDHVWAVALISDDNAAACKRYEEAKQRVPTVDEGGILAPSICDEIWPDKVFHPASFGVFHSPDRGKSWENQFSWVPDGGTPEDPSTATTVTFVNEQEGSVNLFEKSVLQTTDGGKSWQEPGAVGQ